MLRFIALVLLACTNLTAAVAATDPLQPIAARWSTLSDTVFEHLGTANGLPHQGLNAIAEDGDGFIWFGTQGGLARWDGYRFRNYRPNNKDGSSLPDNFIQALYTDRHGRLWIGTNSGGMARYDRDHDNFIHVPVGVKGVSHVSVKSIIGDGGDGLWIATEGGLDHYLPDSGVVTHFQHNDTDATSLPGNVIKSILRDKQAKLWVVTNKGLVVQGDKGGAFIAVPLLASNGENARVRIVGQSSDGKIWIGTSRDGTYFIDPKDNIPRPLLETNGKEGAFKGNVISIDEPRRGEVWLGTISNGILVVDTATLESRHLLHEPALPSSLVDNTVQAIFHDRSGLIWVGTNIGISRTYYQNAIRSIFNGVNRPNAMEDSGISAVAPMPDGSIWIGSAQNGVNIIEAPAARISNLPPPRPDSEIAGPAKRFEGVTSIISMPNGDVYMAIRNGIYRGDLKSRQGQRLKLPGMINPTPLKDGAKLWIGAAGLWWMDTNDTKQEKPTRAPGTEQLDKQTILVMARGLNGVLWIGTRHSGLYQYDPATHTLLNMAANPANNAALSNNFVSSLLVDSKDRLWVGTLGGGINVLVTPNEKGQPRFRRFGTAEGFPSEMVGTVLEANDGNIWVSTDTGLAKINSLTFAITPIQRAEGAAIPVYYNDSGAKTSNGELLFGGVIGLTVVRPDLYKDWSYHPPVVITDVKIGGKGLPGSRFNGAPNEKADLPEALTITPEANSIAVEFAALDFSAPERNHYAYRLDGYDKDWVESDSTRRLASYTNLPPGNYRLKIRGSNRNGVWTERELDLPIKVLPAWYQTWWIRLIAILLALAVMYGLVQGRTRYLRERQRELKELVNQRTNELQNKNQELHHSQDQLLEKNHQLNRMQEELLEKNEELKTIALRDGLTGVANRRAFDERIEEEFGRIRRNGQSLSFLIIDIDHFKSVNDLYGHQIGDECLRQMGKVLISVNRRPSDFVARYGGEEFAYLLSDTDTKGAELFAERVLRAVRAIILEIGDIRHPITASIGVATATGSDMENPAQLIAIADQHLFTAKNTGRNRLVNRDPDIELGLP